MLNVLVTAIVITLSPIIAETKKQAIQQHVEIHTKEERRENTLFLCDCKKTVSHKRHSRRRGK